MILILMIPNDKAKTEMVLIIVIVAVMGTTIENQAEKLGTVL